MIQTLGHSFGQTPDDTGTLDNRADFKAVGSQFIICDWDKNTLLCLGFCEVLAGWLQLDHIKDPSERAPEDYRIHGE